MLAGLPERGWAVVRAEPVLVLGYVAAGLLKAQRVHGQPCVFQVRLTAAGRRYRREVAP